MKKFKFTQVCNVVVECEIDAENLETAKHRLDCIIDDMPEVSATTNPIEYDIPQEPFVYDAVKVTYKYDKCCGEFKVEERKV